jgi:hypothetical protein
MEYAGSGGGNGGGTGGTGGGFLVWEVGSLLEMNGILSLNGVHFFGFDCGFGVWMVLFLDLGM